MIAVYNVQTKFINQANTIAGNTSVFASSGRSLVIITDSIQSALSIARARLNTGEEIESVYEGALDPIIDYTVCKGAI